MSKRRLVLAIAALLAAGAGAGGVYALRFAPLAVETVAPETDVDVRVYGLGTVEAQVLSNVGFAVPGRLDVLSADHGDRVPAGAVLARLDSGEQEARVLKARAAGAEAEAALKQAAARMAKARAVLVKAQQINERRQTLAKRGTVSTEAAEDSLAEANVAAAELSIAQSESEVGRARVEDAHAQLRLEEEVLDKHVLRAPYEAVVVARQKELGSVLPAGEPVFTLIDPRSVWGQVYVDEAVAGGLAPEQPAEVHLRSLPGETFRARIVRLNIETDRVSEERRVHVRCERCPAPFFLGEQIEAWFTVARLPRALLVPQAAIAEFRGDRGTVWVVEDGRLAKRELRFGHRMADGRLEIADELPAGTAVVARLRDGMRPGRAARIVGGVP